MYLRRKINKIKMEVDVTSRIKMLDDENLEGKYIITDNT